MIALLDVNVLVAIAWPTHVHHADARAWFLDAADDGWATTPVTEHGFVRISVNPAAVGEPISPREAATILKGITSAGRHEFWPDAVSAQETSELLGERLATHRQITDGHLLTLAARNHGTLATLDRGVAELAGRNTQLVTLLTP